MNDVELFNKLIRGSEIMDSELMDVSKRTIDCVADRLISCNQEGKAIWLRMRHLGIGKTISESFRRPLW